MYARRRPFGSIAPVLAGITAAVAALTMGPAGVAAASTVPDGQLQVCDHSTDGYAVDAWDGNEFLVDVPPGACGTVFTQSSNGTNFQTISFFVHHASPGIEIGIVTYDLNQGMGVVVDGTQSAPSLHTF